MKQASVPITTMARTNGAGAAAVLAAAIGSLNLGILTIAGDKSPAIKAALIFYKPTGALSGVTTLSIIVWLLAWAVLHGFWSKRSVSLKSVVTVSFALLAIALMATFPPFIDLL